MASRDSRQRQQRLSPEVNRALYVKCVVNRSVRACVAVASRPPHHSLTTCNHPPATTRPPFRHLHTPPHSPHAHRNLPYKITAEEMYDLFGKYGAIRQIRMGHANDTKGTAFVVYEDIYDAKNAVEHLSGFNVCGRYLIVLYYQPTKMQKKMDEKRKRKELAVLKAKWEKTQEGEAAAAEE